MENTKFIPFIGYISMAIQCIFVKRSSAESRLKVRHDITKRVDAINNGKNMPSLLLFPEGSINNGRDLMSFKQGAFEDYGRIKIYAFEF